MSCSTTCTPSYNPKVNIYNDSFFIPLPTIRNNPPPSFIYLRPEIVYQPSDPSLPPTICPLPQAMYPPGRFCNLNGASTTSGCYSCS